MIKSVLAAGAATLLALVGVPAARSQAPSYQTAALPFTTSAPGASTGFPLSIDYRPAGPGGKPHSVRTVVIQLHPGTRIDTSVPDQCKASDAEFAEEGAGACPPGSRVGAGTIEFDNGSPAEPRIIKTRVTLFNNRDELILLNETTNTPGPPARVAARAKIEGAKITTEVPPLPGAPPPDPFLAVKTVRETVMPVTRRRGGSRRSYITTPDSCPASGRWTNTIAFTYRDGVTQTVRTSSPCTGTGRRRARRRRARLRLRLRYRKRGRCARGRVRATVTGRDRRRARRAVFYMGRRRVGRDRRPPLSKVIDRGRHYGRNHSHTARAKVRMDDRRLVTVRRRYRVCPRRRR